MKLTGLYNNIINENKKRKRLITEFAVTNKTIINCDIQPEYEDWITFDINSWVNFLNSNSKNKIIFLYNGYDTLGMVDEETYKNWLMDLGIKPRIINNSVFYDKGYAFFRSCMDSGIDETLIVNLVKFMITNNINDSRDITEEMWDDFMSANNHYGNDIRELLEYTGEMINIPDLMDFLQNYNNIVLTGGGIRECLKEVEIALLALNKNFNIISEYTY